MARKGCTKDIYKGRLIFIQTLEQVDANWYSLSHFKRDKTIFKNSISEKFRKQFYFFICILPNYRVSQRYVDKKKFFCTLPPQLIMPVKTQYYHILSNFSIQRNEAVIARG